jgi:hypothetical protein
MPVDLHSLLTVSWGEGRGADDLGHRPPTSPRPRQAATMAPPFLGRPPISTFHEEVR